MKKEAFEDLKLSFTEMLEHAQGKRNDLRVTTVLRQKPLKPISRTEIAKIRAKLHVSQSSFASLLNVSTKTVQSWEQGLKMPSGPSLKLLTIAKKHPESLL